MLQKNDHSLVPSPLPWLFLLAGPAGWLSLVAFKHFLFQTGTIADYATMLLKFHFMVPCRLLAGWQCWLAGSLTTGWLFLSQTFFVLEELSISPRQEHLQRCRHWAVLLCHDAAILLVPACLLRLAGTVHWWLIVVFQTFFILGIPSPTPY